MVRSAFCRQLEKHHKTKGSVVEKCRIANEVKCGGICSGMESTILQYATTLRFGIEPVQECGKNPGNPVELELEFGELDEASDALLLGFPDIAKLDTRFYIDDDENVWVEFRKLGVTTLAESQRVQND